jgi:hypothetical protein
MWNVDPVIKTFNIKLNAPIMRASSSGFEFGMGKDLPSQLEIRLSSWSHDVLYALRHAFSDSSRFHKIAHMETNGYQALQVIFSENHPNITQIPDLLVDTTPKQRQNESMHQFWMRFIDHYKIKSWYAYVCMRINIRTSLRLLIIDGGD